MSKLPWYFVKIGKSQTLRGKMISTYKLHWIYVFYITIKILLKKKFVLTERKSKLKML